MSHATKLRSAKPLVTWQRQQILEELYDLILAECQQWAATRTAGVSFRHPDDPLRMEDEHYNPKNLGPFWQVGYQIGDYSDAAARLKPLLASHLIDLPEDSLEFKQLAAEGMRYAIAACREAEKTIVAGELDEGTLARLARRHGRTPAPAGAVAPKDAQRVADATNATAGGATVSANTGTSPDVPPASRRVEEDPRLPTFGTPLREVFKAFVADKEGGSWKAEAADDAWRALELFEALVGRRAIGEIVHGDAAMFAAEIQRLPKHHGKGPSKQRVGPREAIKKAGAKDAELKDCLNTAVEAGEITPEERERRLAEGLQPRCGRKTVNKHLDYIGACLKWANKRYGWELKNPFADNRYSKRELRKSGRPRKAMKDSELKELFETPIFTGCLSDDRRTLPGKLILKDSFYWVPLVSAFAGARLEEICQLTLSDIVQVDDTWCIRVSDEEDDQAAKTDAALRLIPLHPTLIKLGLVERVLKLRKNNKRRLFPDLAAGGKYHRYGYALSKRWTYYRRRVGLYAAGKDFHTLRHSFNTHLLNKKIPVVWMSQIMGHATSSQTAGYGVNFETSSTYYGGAEISMLNEAVAQFDFGLELVEVDGEWQIARS